MIYNSNSLNYVLPNVCVGRYTNIHSLICSASISYSQNHMLHECMCNKINTKFKKDNEIVCLSEILTLEIQRTI